MTHDQRQDRREVAVAHPLQQPPIAAAAGRSRSPAPRIAAMMTEPHHPQEQRDHDGAEQRRDEDAPQLGKREVADPRVAASLDAAPLARIVRAGLEWLPSCAQAKCPRRVCESRSGFTTRTISEGDDTGDVAQDHVAALHARDPRSPRPAPAAAGRTPTPARRRPAAGRVGVLRMHANLRPALGIAERAWRRSRPRAAAVRASSGTSVGEAADGDIPVVEPHQQPAAMQAVQHARRVVLRRADAPAPRRPACARRARTPFPTRGARGRSPCPRRGSRPPSAARARDHAARARVSMASQ